MGFCTKTLQSTFISIQLKQENNFFVQLINLYSLHLQFNAILIIPIFLKIIFIIIPLVYNMASILEVQVLIHHKSTQHLSPLPTVLAFYKGKSWHERRHLWSTRLTGSHSQKELCKPTYQKMMRLECRLLSLYSSVSCQFLWHKVYFKDISL